MAQRSAPPSSGASRQRKGEIAELQDALNSNKVEQKREAIRKIIDAMTRGKDVSMLFPDIVKNMETNNMELKKLIYLYIINYAKSQPELTILAVNSFRKDAVDKYNPFLRALAVRTMGCIRVKQITEYLLEPLKKAIKDEDSYVRKTAAICIAKLYDTMPELIEEQGFLKLLDTLVNDGNAMVVSNAVCAQMQIQESKGETLVKLTPSAVQKLLTAMNECNEWGIIYILDALAMYAPADAREVESILERVQSRLSHQNPGVVLSATRVIMKYLDFLTNAETVRGYCKRLTQPLIFLVSAEPEIQYVTLKNINLVIQKRPIVMERELKVFFCNFNDPIYIKLQKLEILIRLANNENIHNILLELKEYTQEVDVEFVRKAIRAIGRCAIKLDKAAEKCVYVLWECLKTKVQYVVYETIIVIRDIFRKYPRKYEAILKDLCDNLRLEDPDAKASMIWIIGEYAETIANADQLLANFAESFKEEPSVVQHSILMSCVKLFLLRPNDGYTLVQKVMKQATQECENPDLRDRGFVYWRLMGTDLQLAKKIVFGDRPAISDSSYTLESEILDRLLENIGTLSSVYYKPPEQFVKRLRDMQNLRQQDEDDELAAAESEFLGASQQIPKDMYGGVESQENYESSSSSTSGTQGTSSVTSASSGSDAQPQQTDLLDMGDDYSQATSAPQPSAQAVQQRPQVTANQAGAPPVLPQAVPDAGSKNIRVPPTEVLNEGTFSTNNKANGLNIQAAFQREGEKIYLYLTLTNKSNNVFSDFGVRLGPNPFKLSQLDVNLPLQQLVPGQAHTLKTEVQAIGQSDNQPPSTPFKVQALLKTNLDVFAFTVPCSLSTLIVSGGLLTPQVYQEYAQNYAKKTESLQSSLVESAAIKAKFADNNLYLVGSRVNPQGVEMMSFSGRAINAMPLMFDLIVDAPKQLLNFQFIAPHPSMLNLLHQAVAFILKF